MNNSIADEILKSFVKNITPFCAQDARKIIPNDFFNQINTPTIDFEINYDNCFFKPSKNYPNYRNASWSIKIIAETFLQYCSIDPKSKKPSVSSEVRGAIPKALKDNIESLIPGIDVDVITAISGERYESTVGKSLTIAMIPAELSRDDIKSIVSTALLFNKNAEHELDFKNVHAIRKLLNMTKDDGALAMLMDDKRSTRSTVGLIPYKDSWRFPCIRFPGNMEWELYLPKNRIINRGKESICVLRCALGRFQIPRLDIDTSYKGFLAKYFCADYKPKKSEVKTILTLLDHARKAPHGSSMVIGDIMLIKAEAERLCEKGRGIGFKENGIPLDFDHFKKLSSIDGALLVDITGVCWACGVILDGEVCVAGDLSRGARYNSMNNYIKLRHKEKKSSALGIVVSEDGMYDIITGCSTDSHSAPYA